PLFTTVTASSGEFSSHTLAVQVYHCDVFRPSPSFCEFFSIPMIPILVWVLFERFVVRFVSTVPFAPTLYHFVGQGSNDDVGDVGFLSFAPGQVGVNILGNGSPIRRI